MSLALPSPVRRALALAGVVLALLSGCDGGRTWRFTSGLATEGPGVSGFDLAAVRFLGERRGLIAGSGGEVLATDDAASPERAHVPGSPGGRKTMLAITLS